jgi:hypothetical protein
MALRADRLESALLGHVQVISQGSLSDGDKSVLGSLDFAVSLCFTAKPAKDSQRSAKQTASLPTMRYLDACFR